MLKKILIVGLFFNTISVFPQWELVTDTLKDIDEIYINGNEIFCGTLGNIYYSADNGNTWISKNQGLKYWSSVVDFASNDSLIIIGCAGDGVFISTNNGNLWIEKDFGLKSKNVQNVIIHKQLLFAGEEYNPITFEDGGLYVSSNMGITWTKVDRIVPGAISHLFSDDVTIFAANSSFLIRSMDDGHDWLGVFPYPVNAINKIEKNIIIASRDSICISNDDGETWQTKREGLSLDYISDITVTDSIVFVSDGSRNGKIFVSLNMGENWHSIYDNLPDLTNGFASIGANKDYLFVSFHSGCLWRRPINTITSLESDKYEIPKNISISQNFPNPFNPSTIINYSIPKQSNVKLIIFDALGREVITLVNEEKRPGSYEVEFESAIGNQQLASGIYFYQLRAGEFVQTKKMILLR
ncbi:MAG: T9SS type A sorting domain-containing protein [Ignavibacteriaceae bacterium]|nr:T9SS type A sorting domain-containing protein [Ignavibacteriaceae bacterium]